VERLAILLVEQNLPMALRVSDHTLIVSKGKIVYESSPQELDKNNEIKEKYLCAQK
jgi:branched-chain amino acid transport system ATP-binding protein